MTPLPLFAPPPPFLRHLKLLYYKLVELVNAMPIDCYARGSKRQQSRSEKLGIFVFEKTFNGARNA